MLTNGAKIIILFHFWPYLFYTIFEDFLEKVFVFLKKTIFTLYNMHIILFIATHIAQNIAETCQRYFQSFSAIEILS